MAMCSLYISALRGGGYPWRVLAMLSLLADQTLIEQAALLKVLVYMLCCINNNNNKKCNKFKVGCGAGD